MRKSIFLEHLKVIRREIEILRQGEQDQNKLNQIKNILDYINDLIYK